MANKTGFACGDGGCLPLSEEQATAIWDLAMRQKSDRAERMPDTESAVRAMCDATNRLRELGWRDAMYAPKDRPLLLIEAGSSGIHHGYRDDIGFWIEDGDTWPSRPVLFREQEPATAALDPVHQEPKA